MTVLLRGKANVVGERVRLAVKATVETINVSTVAFRTQETPCGTVLNAALGTVSVSNGALGASTLVGSGASPLFLPLNSRHYHSRALIVCPTRLPVAHLSHTDRGGRMPLYRMACPLLGMEEKHGSPPTS